MESEVLMLVYKNQPLLSIQNMTFTTQSPNIANMYINFMFLHPVL